MEEPPDRTHTVSIVIPVYRGADTLPALVAEIYEVATAGLTPDGLRFRVDEIVLVNDCGPDRSDETIRRLESSSALVRPVWLSRNFGQHAATLAGMASSACDWVVTMDEDGQHDPGDIPRMLDLAVREAVTVVYGVPSNDPPHGALRNLASRMAKGVFVQMLAAGKQPPFSSFRLVLGEIARSTAAYSGPGVYLDVALGWVTQEFAACPVVSRSEGRRQSGYSLRSLLSHFWRLVLTSGTRPLRLVSLLGAIAAVVGFIGAIVIVIGRVTGSIDVEGWASLSVLVLVGFGLILLAVGTIAEYLGVAVRMAQGQPPYLIVSDPAEGALSNRADPRVD